MTSVLLDAGLSEAVDVLPRVPVQHDPTFRSRSAEVTEVGTITTDPLFGAVDRRVTTVECQLQTDTTPAHDLLTTDQHRRAQDDTRSHGAKSCNRILAGPE